MSKTKPSRHKRSGMVTPARTRIVTTIVILLSLFAGWKILATSGGFDSVFRQKSSKRATVSTASFNSNSPSKEYIYAGGRLVATEEPMAAGCTSPSAPGTPTATPLTSNSVRVSWTASPGTVDHYEVERRNGSGSYALVASVPVASETSISITDASGLNGDTAYLYRIRAFSDQLGTCPSPYSGADLATTTDFTIDPPAGPGTAIYASHLLRLRTAVNAVRSTAGLLPFDWGDSSLPVTVAPSIRQAILKDQIQKLRNSLRDARNALGLAPQPYSNEPLTVGIPVAAIHILELRQGVQ